MSQEPTITEEEATYRVLLSSKPEPDMVAPMLNALLANEIYLKPLQEARTVAILGMIADTDLCCTNRTKSHEFRRYHNPNSICNNSNKI